jgi:hypothetical protein
VKTRQRIDAINGAIKRIDDGSWGECTQCGADIPAARILVSGCLVQGPNAAGSVVSAIDLLLADGRTSEALAIASTNPDPVLAAVEMAEIELARKSTAEARRALARVDARMQGTFMPMRTLSERVQRIGAAISRVEASAEGHQP